MKFMNLSVPLLIKIVDAWYLISETLFKTLLHEEIIFLIYSYDQI